MSFTRTPVLHLDDLASKYGVRYTEYGVCPVHNCMGDRLGLPGAVYTRGAQRTT